jgi:hypothetical protein
MNNKKHILCYICQEPQCLGKECMLLADRKEIARSLIKIPQGNRTIVKGDKTLTPVKNTIAPVNKLPLPPTTSLTPTNETRMSVSKFFISYLPGFFRGVKKSRPLPVKREKTYVACYICDEEQCLGAECIFRTDPDNLTRGMQNFIHYRYVPLSSGKPKSVTWENLQIHATKLFWFMVVMGTIMYILVVGGLGLLSTTFSTLQSEIPLQYYIAVYAVGVTVVCLALANLFGTDSETA